MSKSVSDIIREYLASGDYVGTFEEIYARAQESNSNPPWAYMQATPDLVQWAEKVNLDGYGKSAIVVGCGMGDDAEYLARRDFKVTAFDVSETAIAICLKRFPNSKVNYQQADLFSLPQTWHHAFDFVLENRTIQSLPSKIYQKTMQAIATLVDEDGTLLILANGRDPQAPKDSIPWPLSRHELQHFTELGLTEIDFDDIQAGSVRRFVVQYQR